MTAFQDLGDVYISEYPQNIQIGLVYMFHCQIDKKIFCNETKGCVRNSRKFENCTILLRKNSGFSHPTFLYLQYPPNVLCVEG